MTETAPRNRYGMGTEEQVRDYETWLRSEPDRYLRSCLESPTLSDEERAFIQSVLNERQRW